ncbi:MAG: DUF3524 domain-containing protein [Pseudomonadota bacterium]
MNVLLLSAYAARSHEHWRSALMAMFPEWQWHALALPPRHFSWRVRGNALYWSRAERVCLEQPWDLVIATSMVDLATLRGLVPSLACRPSLLYFHENQFAYPAAPGRETSLEAQVVSLYSALAADRIAFNSEFNRRTFLSGCAALLEKLPDFVPVGVVDDLRSRSDVLPVPVDPDRRDVEPLWPGTERDGGMSPLRIVWVGRFEWDKGPDRLLGLLRQAEARGLNYELAMIGQQFRNVPTDIQAVKRHFSHRLVQFGNVASTDRYKRYLAGADIVLSTAVHEFQGLAVMEAVQEGCVPLLPNRLSYPEVFDARFLYASHCSDLQQEARAAVDLLMELGEGVRTGTLSAPSLASYESAALRIKYDASLKQLSGIASLEQ